MRKQWISSRSWRPCYCRSRWDLHYIQFVSVTCDRQLPVTSVLCCKSRRQGCHLHFTAINLNKLLVKIVQALKVQSHGTSAFAVFFDLCRHVLANVKLKCEHNHLLPQNPFLMFDVNADVACEQGVMLSWYVQLYKAEETRVTSEHVIDTLGFDFMTADLRFSNRDLSSGLRTLIKKNLNYN